MQINVCNHADLQIQVDVESESPDGERPRYDSPLSEISYSVFETRWH
jgi:hypothetical protein